MGIKKSLPAQTGHATRMSRRTVRQGAALLTVIFIMLVFSVLAAGLAALIFSGSRSTVDDYRYDRAFYIAEAGRKLGVKQVFDMADWSGVSGMLATKIFGGGCFVVSALSSSTQSITIQSIGILTLEAKTYQRAVKSSLIKEVWGFRNEYVLYWGGSGGGGSTAIGNNVEIYGDVLANSSIVFGNGATVEGDVYASGTITGGAITGTREPGASMPSDPPQLNTSYYDTQISLAASSSTPGQSWGDCTINTDWYINGNLIVGNNNTISVAGPHLVVVNGTVTTGNGVIIGSNLTLIAKGAVIMGNSTNIGDNCLFYSRTSFTFGNEFDSGSFAAGHGTSFLTPGNITCGNGNSSMSAAIDGLIYCGGTLTMGNNINFYGNIVANKVSTMGNNSQLHLSPNLVDYSSIHGLEGGTTTSVSTWEESF
jgi:predicted acyltransferase (DUF342 family)